MKKQFLTTAVIISGILFSCTKEKIGMPTNNANEMITEANSQKGGGGGSVANLNKGLLGRYTFDSTLKDATNQLAAGISTVDRVLYTTDRKGVANRAILFNQAYGINIFGVPLGTDMSVSVWVQNHFFPTAAQVPFVEGSSSFALTQYENTYQAAYWNGISGQYVVSGQIDDKWHHLVATRDDISLKFYLDGNLIGSSPTPVGAGPYPGTSDYGLGYGFNGGYQYWLGSMDDLRIYKRVLSASDVTALYNL